MQNRLSRISPADLALFLGTISFVLSVPVVAFAIVTIGPGRTVHLKGLLSLTFTNSLEPVWLVLAYPFLNAALGILSGLIAGWLYNVYARCFRGISITLDHHVDA